MTSKSRSRSRKSLSPSLSKYYTPKTSPSPVPVSVHHTQKTQEKKRYGTPTESMKKKVNELFENNKKKYIESPSEKNKRELSEKRREEIEDAKNNEELKRRTNAYKVEKQNRIKKLIHGFFTARNPLKKKEENPKLENIKSKKLF